MIEHEVIIPPSDLTLPWPKLSCSQPGLLTLAAVEQADNTQDHLTAASLHVTGDLSVSGNLGIGISGPQATLDVNGRIQAGKLTLGPWPPDERYVFVGVNTLDQSQHDNYALRQDTQAGGTTYLNSPEAIHFRIGDTDQVILERDGRLTSSNLTVTGDLTVNGKINGRTLAQDRELLDGHVAARNNPHGVTAIQTGALPLTGGAIQGRMGIGVSNPQEMLDVAGRIQAGELTLGPWPANEGFVFLGATTLDQSLPGNYALLQDTRMGGTTALNSPKTIFFRIEHADRMVLDNSGNVGIGMNPQTGARLNIRHDDWQLMIDNPAAGGGFWLIGQSADFWNIRGGKLAFAPNSSNSSHAVVVFTTNGDIQHKGARVQLSSRAYKENIVELHSQTALDVLKDLKPVAFNRKHDSDRKLHLGFVAEEAPDLIASHDHKAIVPDHILAVLTKVVKEQQNILAEFRVKIHRLEEQSRRSLP
jgi:hypothetical protein